MVKNLILKKIILSLIIGFFSTTAFSQNPADFLKRGKKVYIESNNKNVIEHANNKVALWGYWKVISSKKEADFILHLDANFALFYTINAQAITKDNTIIKRFKSKNSFKSLDGNPKRGAVKALFDKEIIPFVHGLD